MASTVAVLHFIKFKPRRVTVYLKSYYKHHRLCLCLTNSPFTVNDILMVYLISELKYRLTIINLESLGPGGGGGVPDLSFIILE